MKLTDLLDRIELERIKRGMTLNEFYLAIGYNRSYLTRVRKGKRAVSLTLVRRLLDIFPNLQYIIIDYVQHPDYEEGF